MSLLDGPGVQWMRKNLPRLPLLVNLAWGAFRDPRVPKPLKAALLGVLAYVASPFDLIPDFLPGIGRVDDLLVLLAAMEMFVRFAPPDVVAEIEARYRQGHGPLREDLEAAERHLGRVWSWARRRVEDLERRYRPRVDDQGYLEELEKRTRRSEESDGTAS